MPRDNVLYREGDSSDIIYFIRSGQVTCSKRLHIPQKDEMKKDFYIDSSIHMTYQEKQAFVQEVQICKWTEATIFGEEEAYEAYLYEKSLEANKDKYYLELKEIFKSERERKNIGFSYQPSVDLPKNPKDDETAINKAVAKKIHDLKKNGPKRQTTVIIDSHHADIWTIGKKVFFSTLENNPEAFNELLSMISSKRTHRSERLEEWTRLASEKPGYIASKPQKLISSKRYIKKDFPEKIIFSGDPDYVNLVNSYKTSIEDK